MFGLDFNFIDHETWLVFLGIFIAIALIAGGLWISLIDERSLSKVQRRLVLLQIVSACREALGRGVPAVNDPDNNLFTDEGNQARAELRQMRRGHQQDHDQ